LAQEVYTGNPLLSSIAIQKYNSSNTSWGWIDSANWSYDSSWGSVTINASVLEHTITQIRVNADTTYAESPHLTVFTAISISLLVMAMGGIFGIIVWNKRKRHY
jgi:phage baseplate assembly protein gpV